MTEADKESKVTRFESEFKVSNYACVRVRGLVHTTRPEEFENEGIRRFPSTLNRRNLKCNNRRLFVLEENTVREVT